MDGSQVRLRRTKENKADKNSTNNKIKEVAKHLPDDDNAADHIRNTERLDDDEPESPQKKCSADEGKAVSDRGDGRSLTSPFTVNIELDLVAIGLFVVAYFSRTYKLAQPRDIVFDELHYGKYVSLYMKNTFFFDQHPPLGKQLIAGLAYIIGYDGNFTFSKIGAQYDENVPVFWLRFIPALCGSLLSPIVYKLLLEMKLQRWTALLGGVLIILDNALLTQSRFVLMESMLLLFSTIGLVFLHKFQSATVYHVKWFLYGALAASFFTFALCIKYVAFYSCCLAATLVLLQLWTWLGESITSNFKLIMKTVTMGLMFTLIPIAVYLGVFYVHLNTLNKAGPHDNVMTSAFQASLDGGLASITKGQPFNVVHGSQITLRHALGRPCWLHSHAHVYPVRYADKRGSSHQQQVTCYSFKDVNNWWIVKRPSKTDLVVGDQPDPIKHGDEIHLVHGITSRALNSHDVAAPVTPQCQEVTCYIDYNVSMPAQILWRVDILNKDQEGPVWHAITSQVRLIHVTTGQALRFSGRQLPDWGFNQHEVVADRQINQDDTVWNVEEHRYTKTEDQKERERQLVNAEMIPVEPTILSFLDKFWELQLKMLWHKDTIQSHLYSSEPLEWPLLGKGIAYWVDRNSNAQIHLLGNIVIWYSATASIVIYCALLLFYMLRRRRHYFDLDDNRWAHFSKIGQTLLLGYFLHYLPYFCVERTLFLHNYLPAFLFKLLLLCFVVEHCYYLLEAKTANRFWLLSYRLGIVFWLVAVAATFYTFSALSYGSLLSADDIIRVRWKDTWDFILHKKLV